MQLIASFAEENGGINDEENCDPDGCVRSVDEHGFGPNCRDLRQELRQAGAPNQALPDYRLRRGRRRQDGEHQGHSGGHRQVRRDQKGRRCRGSEGDVPERSHLPEAGREPAGGEGRRTEGNDQSGRLPADPDALGGHRGDVHRVVCERRGRHRPHHLRRGDHRRIGRGVGAEESLSPPAAAAPGAAPLLPELHRRPRLRL